jgi:flagellar basal-body rod protein FlgB
MFGQTEAITVEVIKMALDTASMRHQAISNNIANINTAGYRPVSVEFEQQLSAARAALRQGEEIQPSMLSGIRPVVARGAIASDADRTATLDSEVADMAQNTVHYEALIKALSKHFSILSSAIAEGKR